MADTGYNWDANWSVLDAAITLTQGGTITDQSDEIISILRDIDDTVYESAKGAAVSFEMPFTINATERKTISLDCSQFQKIVLVQDWGNTTGGAEVVTATAYKFATIPVAS